MYKQDKGHRKIRKCIEGPNFSGQHLLHNKKIVDKMIEIAKLQQNDTVLEIGAGKGALTFRLAEKAGKVLAVENDADFVESLQNRAIAYSNIRIIQQDILQIRLPKESYCVVANIPYAITTPILRKLLNQPGSHFQRAVLMVEKGAAIRFTSEIITQPEILSWRMWFDMEMVTTVSKTNFSPPPRVDSAVLQIQRKQNPSVAFHWRSCFAALAQYGLKYPQLSIQEALNGIFTATQMARLIKNLGVDRCTRICSLNVQQWGIIFQTMAKHVAPYRWPKSKRRR